MASAGVRHSRKGRLNLSMTAEEREAIELIVLAESARQGKRLTVSEFARQRLLAPVRYEPRAA